MSQEEGESMMRWSRPNFEEISLCMEVTAYANTDAKTPEDEARSAPTTSSAGTRDARSAATALVS